MKLYPIINLYPGEIADTSLLSKVFKINPKYIQLRIKNGVFEDFEKNYELLKKYKEKYKAETKIIINDRADFANNLGSYGVHVGIEEGVPSQIKSIYPNLAVGWSTHNIEQVLKAQKEPAEYIGFGPCFPTTTKETSWSCVSELASKVLEISAKPVVFIGGINKDNCKLLPDSEKSFIAVISSLKQFLE